MRYIFFCSLLLIVCHSSSAQNGMIKDIDGNVYKTVKIGTQVWMAENLKTAHYRDGSPITEIELDTQWSNAKKGAWCYYQNDSANNLIYGKLYNWYAVADTHHLCPTGWHVPGDDEWTVLADYLGGDGIAGGKMKATTLWADTNNGADNFSRFTALPAGNRNNDGIFGSLGGIGYFWSSTELNSSLAWFRYLGYYNSSVSRFYYYKDYGLSVRCVGD
jgi:uncharacterized protein (TIGR02145 family)